MSSDLSTESIESALSGRFGRPLTFLETTDSTNERAVELLMDGAPEGALVVADHQTAGRGRRGRSWESPAGSGLLFSLVLRPGSGEALALITTAVGVAVAESLDNATGVEARIKWPNDVVVNSRKLAGILVESRLSTGAIEGSVAGVGVNVSWPASESDATRLRATSIELLGRSASRADLLAALLEGFEEVYRGLEDEDGRAEVVRRAKDRSAVLGGHVTVRLGDGSTLEGRAADLTSTGALVIEVQGRSETIDAGEIERLRTT